MSTDAICTCGHGLGVLRHADDCPVAVERRQPVRLALSAPSEPAAKINEFDVAAAADASYQRGFDHGRRWAAEEVLRIAAEEIRLQSSWLWHALGEERLTEVAALFGRWLIREMEPPAAPSEPVRPEPRVWAMPPEPGPDVVRVRDVYGQIFERATAYGGEKPEEGWLGDTFASEADVPDLFLTWELLMKHHTPVTEIGPEPKIRDTHGEYAIEVFDLEPGGADCFVVLRQGDEELKHFRYPAYKIWTLLAHWKEYDEVNPAAEVVEP